MSNGEPKPTQHVTIFYQKNEHYKLLLATGVVGGPTPAGDVLADFFIERQTPPDNIVLEIGGAIPKEIERKGGGRFEREIQVGIMFRADVAYNIGKWLIDKAAQAGFTEVKQ